MSPRAVSVVTEVAAVDRAFDYAVGENVTGVDLGDRVRVSLGRRSVRGWVVGEAAVSENLKPLTKWLGLGVTPEVLELARWASWRWAAPLARFLGTASPPRIVTHLPTLPERTTPSTELLGDVDLVAPGAVALAPVRDPLGVVLGAYHATAARGGTLLVLVPSEAWAARLRQRLVRRGVDVAGASGEPFDEWVEARAGWPVVVGTRSAAFLPVATLSGAVVLDADDPAHVSEAAPTWNAFEVVRERCRRVGAPWWATSAVPSPRVSGEDRVHHLGDASQWPEVQVIDRRQRDPHDGVLSPEAVDAAHEALESPDEVAVSVILQRLGAGRLLACRRCGSLARCAQCGQAESEREGKLGCRDEHEWRPRFCRDCGSTNLALLRAGVTTLARDVALQLGHAVSELDARHVPDQLERVVVGTEAVLYRVRRCALVIFVDFDQYLLAPRSSARRDALSAIGRAGRLTGGREQRGGRVILQTRRPGDLVVECAVMGDAEPLRRADLETAKILNLPPFGSRALVTGSAAESFVARLGEGVTVSASAEGYILRSRDVGRLCDELARAGRAPKGVRVAVE